MPITIRGQRWSPWNVIPLGFPKHGQTISSHGCTITCVGMLGGLNPDQVNQKLQSVTGFQESSILWQKINEAIPWLSFEWRGYAYDDDKVKAAITKNGGCLVEVDFDGNTARTDDKHWVLAIGGGKIYDPWTGKEELFSKYSIKTGYAVINIVGTAPIGGDNMADTVSLPSATFETLVSKSTKYDAFTAMGYSDPTLVKKELDTKQSTIESLSNEKKTQQVQIDSLNGHLSEYAASLQTANTNYSTLNSEHGIVVDQLSMLKRVAKDEYGIGESSFSSEQAFSKALAGLSKGGNVSELNTSELLGEIMRRFTSALDVFKKKE